MGLKHLITPSFLPGYAEIRNRPSLAIAAAACSADRIRTFAQSLRVSHAAVDFLGELKVSALLGFLEQAAIEASADAGFDPARYTAEGRVWIIRRTRLERLVPVGGGDSLTISTHVSDFRRARSLRRYQVLRTGGYDHPAEAPVVRASTDWVYCDVATGRPVSVPAEMKLALFGTTDVPTEPRADRVRPPEDPPSALSHTRVRPSHLDHMGHVNNAIWADFLEDAALELLAERGSGLDEMLDQGGALRVETLDIEYLGDARLGDDLRIQSWISGDSPVGRRTGLVQTIERPDGQSLLRARSKWRWRIRPAVLGGIPTA